MNGNTLYTLDTLNTLHPASASLSSSRAAAEKLSRFCLNNPSTIQLYGAWLVLGQATWVKLVPMNI